MHIVMEKVRASIAVASTVLGVSTVMLASVPAEATHKPYCGKRWVETGTFFVDKFCPNNINKATSIAKTKCKHELEQRGEYTYGANFASIEKTAAHCVLQKQGDICKFWCVCSGEPCWKPYSIKPGDYKFQRSPSPDPPSKGLRMPIRPPSGGLTIPNLRR